MEGNVNMPAEKEDKKYVILGYRRRGNRYSWGEKIRGDVNRKSTLVESLYKKHFNPRFLTSHRLTFLINIKTKTKNLTLICFLLSEAIG